MGSAVLSVYDTPDATMVAPGVSCLQSKKHLSVLLTAACADEKSPLFILSLRPLIDLPPSLSECKPTSASPILRSDCLCFFNTGEPHV